MPLTLFQRDVIRVLAAHREECSHFAGGMVLHSAPDSARYSQDFDVFHDSVEDVCRKSQEDILALEAAGFAVAKVTPAEPEWSSPGSFRRARVSRGADLVEVDWAHDSVFRFFPVVPDPLMGFRLHLFDMAVNKALALTARSETRDYVDIVELSRRFPLASIVWAACGKDPGFSPQSVLKWMLRFAKIDPAKLAEIQARRLDPISLKEEWLTSAHAAEDEITRIANTHPDLPIGVAFVDERGEPGWIGTNPGLRPHAASLRGTWPTVRVVER